MVVNYIESNKAVIFPSRLLLSQGAGTYLGP